MADWDRMKAPLFALIKAALPRIDYYALYYGKVVTWDPGHQTVDVRPNDPKLPTMSEVPMRGPAGFAWTIDPLNETSVLVGWENGDPSRPFALCAFTPGAHVQALTVNADRITLGGSIGAELAAKGQTLQTYLDQLAKLITAHVHPTGSGPSGTAANLADIAPPELTASNVSVK